MQQQKRILIADDDAVVLKAVGGFLERHGYSVGSCQDGPTALRKARTEHPDLILLDLEMASPRPTLCPIFDGYTVLGWLRSFPETAKTPVVVLTHFLESEAKPKAMLAGATAFFQKPADMDRLLSAIRIELDQF
jgi:CheY-like chemotaxis protein